MLAHNSSTVETHRRQKTTSFGRSTLTNCVTVARDETATEPERESDESRCAEFTELSHVTKQQLSQNARVTKVDVPSSQNCRTAISKSHSHTVITINAVAELAETSMKKSASTCTNHCKIHARVFRDRKLAETSMKKSVSTCTNHCKIQPGRFRGREFAETSMKKSASTCTNHCKIQVSVFRGSNFMRQNENRCADFTMRGRRRKVQGRPTAETSRKN